MIEVNFMFSLSITVGTEHPYGFKPCDKNDLLRDMIKWTPVSPYYNLIQNNTNNLKKQGKNFTRNSKTHTNKNFKEIFHTNFSEELKEAIRNTELKKQPGPDNIFPEFIHNLGQKAMKIQ
jgi:hypothetical protein